MRNFEQGEKIVCIDNFQVDRALTNGDVYTVKEADEYTVTILIKSEEYVFRLDRFISLKEFRVKKIKNIYGEV